MVLDTLSQYLMACPFSIYHSNILLDERAHYHVGANHTLHFTAVESQLIIWIIGTRRSEEFISIACELGVVCRNRCG